MRVRSGPATVTRAFITISKDPGSQDVCRRWPLSHPRVRRPSPDMPRAWTPAGKGMRCGRFRSRQLSVPKTWHSR